MVDIILYTVLVLLSLCVISFIMGATSQYIKIKRLTREVKAHREEIKYLESLTRRKQGIENQYIKDKLNIK